MIEQIVFGGLLFLFGLISFLVFCWVLVSIGHMFGLLLRMVYDCLLGVD